MDPWPVVAMEIGGMALSVIALVLALVLALDNQRRK